MAETMKDIHREIERQETEILTAKRRLAELRQQAPPEEFPDYELKAWDGGTTKLSELFGDRDDLILVHNMGKSCTYCTMWADGINGVLDHLENRAAVVVVSPDPPEVQQEFARGRGWRFRMVSAEASSLNRDAGFEENGSPMPGVSTFRRGGEGKVYRVASAEFGPGDDFCSTWHFLDLLDGGPKGWEPRYRYDG